MQKMMNIVVNSCKKTTELIDKQLFTPLTAKEQIQLKVHKSMCKTCAAYEQQTRMIDNLIGQWFAGALKTKEKLNEDVKNKIINEIQKN